LADAPGYTVVTLTTVFDSFGILPDRQYGGGPETDQEDQQADDDREDGRLMKISVKAMQNYPAEFQHFSGRGLEDRRPSFVSAVPVGPRHMSIARRLRRNRRTGSFEIVTAIPIAA